MTNITEQLDRITTHVERYGIDRSERQLRMLAALAQTYHVLPAIVSLLTDRAAPDVVRSRAFSRIVVGLRAAPLPSIVLAA